MILGLLHGKSDLIFYCASLNIEHDLIRQGVAYIINLPFDISFLCFRLMCIHSNILFSVLTPVYLFDLTNNYLLELKNGKCLVFKIKHSQSICRAHD